MAMPPTGGSPFEQTTVLAYQMLGQARMQTTLFHEGTTRCIDKCMERDELRTLRRTTYPIQVRLETDKAEKACVAMCAAKWDELMQRELGRLTRGAQEEAAQKMLMAQYEQMMAMAKQ
jgi:glucose-6-phosphate dehydrogenase assembly protein OpcA